MHVTLLSSFLFSVLSLNFLVPFLNQPYSSLPAGESKLTLIDQGSCKELDASKSKRKTVKTKDVLLIGRVRGCVAGWTRQESNDGSLALKYQEEPAQFVEHKKGTDDSQTDDSISRAFFSSGAKVDRHSPPYLCRRSGPRYRRSGGPVSSREDAASHVRSHSVHLTPPVSVLQAHQFCFGVCSVLPQTLICRAH